MLDAQRGLLGELDALSQRQSTLIDGEDMEPLLALLDERQRVIEQFMPASRTLDELRWRWRTVRAALSETRRDQVQRAEDAVLHLFTQVARRDERDQARLKSRLDLTATELAGLATSRRAAGAYGPTANTTARFQDRQA
jgi:predicted phage gp36 major capsid-like protein